MKLWGVIAEVNEKDLVIGLPGGLRGLVRISDALDPDMRSAIVVVIRLCLFLQLPMHSCYCFHNFCIGLIVIFFPSYIVNCQKLLHAALINLSIFILPFPGNGK